MPVTAAYNFVPLSNVIVRPAWGPQVSHDVPLPGGLCAWFDLELTNHTPLLVGGTREVGQNQPPIVTFFRQPDFVTAIPGSSVQGMVRALVEILSFSGMQLYDNRQLAIRDVSRSANDYLKLMVRQDRKTKRVSARSRAGWLRFEDGFWYIHPCPHVLACHDVLADPQGLNVDIQKKFKASPSNPGHDSKLDHRSVQWKYGLFTNSLGASQFRVYTSRPINGEKQMQGGWVLERQVVKRVQTRSVEGCDLPGWLVLTGQPGARNDTDKTGKHFEFIFQAPCDTRVQVSNEVLNRFLEINGDDKLDANLKSSLEPETSDREDASKKALMALAYLRQKKGPFGLVQGIPVFYLTQHDRDDGDIAAIGVSQLFKYPVPKRLGGYLPTNHQPQIDNPTAHLDFTEALFGKVGIRDATRPELPERALKRRVFFGDLRLHGNPRQAGDKFCRPTVLSSPKQSYFPTYVKQDRPDQLRTLLDEAAELAGWKRYPAWLPERVTGVPPLPAGMSERLATSLRPLDIGHRFIGRVYLHNVMPQELGAVLWALTWGGDEGLRHALGLGKAFGLGQVQAKVSGLTVRCNAADAMSTSQAAEWAAVFSKWMDEQHQDWRQTAQLRELLAMADPRRGTVDRLAEMKFSMTREQNAFQQSKNDRGEARGLPLRGLPLYATGT